MGVRYARHARGSRNISNGLRNLAECFGQLGQTGSARDAAAEALTIAETAGDRDAIVRSHAYLSLIHI